MLYEDSTIQRFDSANDKKPDETIKIRDVCQWLSVGPYTRPIPGRPKLPPRGDENMLVCIPKDQQKKEKEILWLLASDLSQLK